MNKKIAVLLIFLLTIGLQANTQNIFPVMVDKCEVTSFCLDCGDQKVQLKKREFNSFIDKLNKKLDIKGLEGAVSFQVLVDSEGNGCVMSHTDASKNAITRKIVKHLNRFDGFTPAVSDGKNEEMVSINMTFTIENNQISGEIKRVDIEAFKKSFDRPVDPVIYNEKYNYQNSNLSGYSIKVWNSNNSNLMNNFNNDVEIDMDNSIWMTIDDGVVNFDGNEFKQITHPEPGLKDMHISELAVDNKNRKWLTAKDSIFLYDEGNWEIIPESELGIDRVYEIVANHQSGEVFICAKAKLVINKDKQWITIDRDSISDFPEAGVLYANRDSQNRLWIGTYKGTIMVDNDGKVTNYELTSSQLKGKGIKSLQEDKEGVLYFGLYKFDQKNNERAADNPDEGILILNSSNEFERYTTDNSGLPANYTTDILYDDNEHILWIATQEAGLVRFDPASNKWENYNNLNSDIPTSYITDLTIDNKGNIIMSTRQGLVKISRR